MGRWPGRVATSLHGKPSYAAKVILCGAQARVAEGKTRVALIWVCFKEGPHPLCPKALEKPVSESVLLFTTALPCALCTDPWAPCP